jgi:hypothetical protein
MESLVNTSPMPVISARAGRERRGAKGGGQHADTSYGETVHPRKSQSSAQEQCVAVSRFIIAVHHL